MVNTVLDVAPAIELSNSSKLSLDDLVAVAGGAGPVVISKGAVDRIRTAMEVVDRALRSEEVVYGLTRHLGDRRDREVTPEDLSENQKRTVIGHASTVGERMPDAEVRALMVARLRGFVDGYSGVSLAVVERFVEMLNRGITPVVRRFGSVGASDLAPLAVIASAAIGESPVMFAGRERPAREVFEEVGLSPLRLSGKDGLALISSNSYPIGVGALALSEFAAVFSLVETAAALYLEAMRGNLSWLDEECSVARPFVGQRRSAKRLMGLLKGSSLHEPGAAASLQDPLSIRSFSHLGGATLEVFARLAADINRELNSSGDNPMVSPDSGRIVSSANFNPIEIAFGFENLRVAIAHLGTVGDRRIQHLMLAMRSAESVIDSVLTFGYSAISAKLKTLAHPVTVGFPSLVSGHEDMVSGAPLAVDATREALGYLRTLAVGEIVIASSLILSKGIPVGAELAPMVDRVKSIIDSVEGPKFGGVVATRLEEELAGVAVTIQSLVEDA